MSDPSPYPHQLTSLTPREAITDALYRALIGFDRNDVAIFDSAFIGEDVSLELRAGEDESRTVNGMGLIRDHVLAVVGPMDTSHMISNVRVDLRDGKGEAGLTCYALAQHCPPGKGKDHEAPKWLVGGEYRIDLVKDEKDGLWKIKKWILDVIWRQGDPSVMAGVHAERAAV